MLKVDLRTPHVRPPSRSDPSPISVREAYELEQRKAATADSPTSSRTASLSYTDAQTSALGKLAQLAGVRADQEQGANLSTANMLERAVANAEDGNTNDHVRLQPPTPSPGLPSALVASPHADLSTDPMSAAALDSPDSSVAPQQTTSHGQPPSPPTSINTHGTSHLGTSSSSTSLAQPYSPYSGYPSSGYEQPQQPSQYA
jgi:hypothetical protein